MIFCAQQAFTDTVKLAERDLPNTGDGKYDYQVAPKQNAPAPGPSAADFATRSKLSILVEKAKPLVGHGLPVGDPVQLIVSDTYNSTRHSNSRM